MTRPPSEGHGTDLLVRAAALPDWDQVAPTAGRIPSGQVVDIRIAAGRIEAVAPGLEPRSGEEVLHAPGAVVLPGLHDHHVHLRALVASRRSVVVGPEEVDDRRSLAEALRRAPVDAQGWRRAVGYHPSVAGDLDRWVLDEIGGDGPLRVQHRSGVLWILNSAGVAALGVDSWDAPGVERDDRRRPTGRLFRMDVPLAERLGAEDPVDDVGPVSEQLAALGVTGVTDATPAATDENVAALGRAVAEGRLRQRLHVMCGPDVRVPPTPLVTRGPCKVMLDDVALPSLESFVETIRTVHLAGSPVAVHCVTPAQLVSTVAAFGDAGTVAGDRVEHGSVVYPGIPAMLSALGITVVTNPGLVYSRGDTYLEEVPPEDLPFLYPCASLVAKGVTVAAGTDAPFGIPDPWLAVRAAHTRRTRRGRAVGAAEAISLRDAVQLFAGAADAPGSPRAVSAGHPGDLCLLADGLVPRDGGSGSAVFATIVAGHVVHDSR